MLQYLIIQLSDTSSSFCHYMNPKKEAKLISLEDLSAGIFFAMKENLMIQFVYPDEELPQKYKDVINTIDHNTIVSSLCEDQELLSTADIVIFNEWTGFDNFSFNKKQIYVLKTSKNDFYDKYTILKYIFPKVHRLNIVFNDIEHFTEGDLIRYKEVLQYLSGEIEKILINGDAIQFNLLTDRLTLSAMNNCNAGNENITLAPDGKFYICPAFYLADEVAVGDVHNGLNIRNPQLYRMDYAPICRHCDAFQCKRCVWLNKQTTLEVNTPSHEQCVIAHLERNASKKLMDNPIIHSMLIEPSEIKEIDYLDPFDIREKWDYETMQQELIKFHKENY